MRERRISFHIPAMMCHQCTGGRPDPSKPLKPKIIGYYTKGKTPNWTRKNEYDAWKDHVRDEAKRQGITIPAATREQPVRIDTRAYFPTNGGCDPENARKAVVDALYQDQASGDRWVYGYHHFPLTDKENPRVEVEITWKK